MLILRKLARMRVRRLCCQLAVVELGMWVRSLQGWLEQLLMEVPVVGLGALAIGASAWLT